MLTDGTQGVIKLSIQVRDIQVEEAFVVSRTSADAILGIPLLVENY